MSAVKAILNKVKIFVFQWVLVYTVCICLSVSVCVCLCVCVCACVCGCMHAMCLVVVYCGYSVIRSCDPKIACGR